MSKFSEVLKNRNFFLLWLGQIISQFGERLAQMALIGLVSLLYPGSTIQLAKLIFLTIFPVFLIGPVAGVYVDRWDRRRTMFVCDFLRCLLVLLLPLLLILKSSLSLIYILIFIIFSVGRFFIPAKLSIVPDLVRKEDLLIANSLVHTTGMVASILGFGIGGLIIEWLGVRGGLCLNAVGFFISGMLIFCIGQRKAVNLKIKQLSREIVEVIRKSVIQEIKEGIVYFIKQRNVRFTGAIVFFLGGVVGAMNVVMIVFVQDALQSTTKDLGLLIAFLGLGLLLGSLVYGRFGQRVSHFKAISFSFIVSGMILAVFVLSLIYYPYFLLAAGLAVILGLGIAPIIISCITLIHRSSQNQMMGRVFSSLDILMYFAFVLFMFLSSLLAEYVGVAPNAILLFVSCSLILLGLLNFVFHRKMSWLHV
ncbi:MAG: MFS transporter [Candidatus Omnitrophica bacterium]|nr:MFS transporter [Candidatus Omnitrophota bacterium]MBU4473541.1 MFS transporter [Candidatus Omnitrophota bacterium]MCG2706690.1 MFS transporter [Candidatus Omnitrophota bacterium]